MPQLPAEKWKEVSPYLDQALSLPEIDRANRAVQPAPIPAHFDGTLHALGNPGKTY